MDLCENDFRQEKNFTEKDVEIIRR